MAGNLPGPPTNSLSRRELLAVLAGAGVVGGGVVLTGEAADENRQTYADVRGTDSVSETVELGNNVPIVATVEPLDEYPDGEAPTVAVELVYVDGDGSVFRTTATGTVTERASSMGSGRYLFRAEADGAFRATLRDQRLGLF